MNMSWPVSPTFETVLSILHYNLSAHTFAIHTFPLHQISSIIDLLASDPVVTCDLLVLDQINKTILNLEWQLDEQHCLAVQWFSILLTHHSASWIPQHIHNIEQPDCRQCHIWQWQPTPHPRHRPEPIIIHGSLSESKSSSSFSSSIQECYRQMPSYPCQPSTTPVASTSTTLTASFPWMTILSDQVLAWTWFEANAPDYLCRLQTVPEEHWWGMAAFPIMVESLEAEETIFQQYYHWFIKKVMIDVVQGTSGLAGCIVTILWFFCCYNSFFLITQPWLCIAVAMHVLVMAFILLTHWGCTLQSTSFSPCLLPD